MRYPLITAGMQWIGKVLTNATDVSFVQFVEEFSVPVASSDIRAAIARADDDDGFWFQHFLNKPSESFSNDAE